jgi:hypothetical protein
MSIQLFNSTTAQKAVPIVTRQGVEDTVLLQPRGRLTLAPGDKVSQHFRPNNEGIVVTGMDEKSQPFTAPNPQSTGPINTATALPTPSNSTPPPPPPPPPAQNQQRPQGQNKR